MTHEERLQLEHATLMAEYESARTEIEGLLESSRQTNNLLLTVISLFVGGLVFFNTQLPLAFLILPLFLYGLTWTQVRQVLITRQVSAHIAQVIAPRVREILSQLDMAHPVDDKIVMAYEGKAASPARSKGGLLLIPALGAGYGLPLLAAIISVGAYLLIARPIGVIGWVLIAVNAAALVYSAALGFMIEFGR
ncbi:MAG: hypothetical protein JXJ17_18265 [Anaerolineae bacterium]|nr:hypothetical protein [Anaerolineae bacterium]